MPITDETENSPVVVGGLGGSGTRVVASMLTELNYYLGDYKNEQLDNLWFTFLFRRPLAFRYFHKSMYSPVTIFDDVMKNDLDKNIITKIKLWYIVAEYILCGYVKNERKKFPVGCLNSILKNKFVPAGDKWGWKEPNAHLFIEQLQSYYPDMKYIHVLRHPLDMAYGTNFQQLYNWHHLFNLPRPTKDNRAELMLAYYDAANSRIIRKGEKLLNTNFITIKLEDLCAKSEETIYRLMAFLQVEPDDKLIQKLLTIPQLPASAYRYKQHNWQELPDARAICDKFGYDI